MLSIYNATVNHISIIHIYSNSLNYYYLVIFAIDYLRPNSDTLILKNHLIRNL